MNKATLELTLCQLLKVSEASKKNYHAYSDERKISFHREIDSLLQKVKERDFNKFDHNDIVVHGRLFSILFTWLDFLNNSTLNNIPFEVVRCLEAVLEEWLSEENYKKFVIVTSLESHLSGFFYYDLDLGGSLTSYLKDKYSYEIDNTLVPINLPKYLIHDYFANVTLYHEIGHFIDAHYKITARIIDSDYAFSAMSADQIEVLKNHLSEHFADLFAVQYMGDKYGMYLNHLAYNEPDCYTHPATQKRIAWINAFLEGKKHFVIEKLVEATKNLTGKELIANRFKVIPTNDFDSLIPADIDEPKQLHYLFIQAWNTWSSDGYIKKNFATKDSYRIINNLVEKSISNFIVKEKWNNSHVPDEERN